MPVRKFLDYQDARKLLREGDVLLFQGGNSLASFFITRASEGLYSHVGVASAVGSNGSLIWECVEFREWKGGRSVNLERYVKQSKVAIDVYRVPLRRHTLQLNEQGDYEEKEVVFNGKTVTNTMRRMTGLPYGWERIWWIASRKIPFLRAFYNIESTTDDSVQDLIYPVCSTAVAYAYSRAGYDLLHNRSDNATEPSDISRSPLLFYLFSLK